MLWSGYLRRNQGWQIETEKGRQSRNPGAVTKLQKVIDASLPSIRIEQLLMEVDRQTGLAATLSPYKQHQSRPKNFYKTLIAAMISQATNLGVVAMSASVKGVTVDMLRHVLQFYVREETNQKCQCRNCKSASSVAISANSWLGYVIVIRCSAFQDQGRQPASLLLPRYYGYYEKAIGIYTHVSDQYAVVQHQGDIL